MEQPCYRCHNIITRDNGNQLVTEKGRFMLLTFLYLPSFSMLSTSLLKQTKTVFTL